MSMIRERIKINNLDVNIKLSIGSTDGLYGYQQEIDNITEETKTELINPVVDNEVRRFQYDSSNGITNLQFYFISGSSFYCDFNYAGFTNNEIISRNTKLLNSFFILDFYDSYDNNTQNKIFRTYLTKTLNGINETPDYKIYNDTINQFYSWYIPQSYINQATGTTVIGYTKFSFYNAKTGTIALFYNKGNEALLTSEKMYFKTEINTLNRTWKFIGSQPIMAYQISPASSYVTKVNNTVTNFENKKQNYPTGNAFSNGEYYTML